MQFYRDILDEIEPQIEKQEIIAITCMWRVGKTTLLHRIYKKIESKKSLNFCDKGIISLFGKVTD